MRPVAVSAAVVGFVEMAIVPVVNVFAATVCESVKRASENTPVPMLVIARATTARARKGRARRATGAGFGVADIWKLDLDRDRQRGGDETDRAANSAVPCPGRRTGRRSH